MDRRPPPRRPLTAEPETGATEAGAHPTGRGAIGAETAAGRPDGYFGPLSEAWRLDREALLLLGAGPRALLMQLAHPLVAEGVDQHSDFRRDPWGRLAATLRSYLGIVYGSTAEGLAEVARLDRLHRAVAGPVRDPVARAVTGAATYEARDPALSLWVHATLVDSTIVACDAWLGPLARGRKERFYRETIPLGLAFGIPAPDLPVDLEAFERYVAGMLDAGGPVRVTPTARSLAEAILHPPLPPLLLRAVPVLGAIPPAAYDWSLWPAIELLPGALRAGYGIPDTVVRRAVSAWLLAGWRAWRPLIPTSLRWMPQARRADRRVAERRAPTRTTGEAATLGAATGAAR